jgi:hypothetical protein
VLPSLSIAALLLVAAAARNEPRVVTFACQVGDGRTRVLARALEENSDDEMSCRARVQGLGGRSAADLVAEISLLPPSGPARVAATDKLAGTDPDAAELRGLLLPHATWMSAVDWRTRPARVRLVLRIYDKPSPGQKRWRLVATGQLEFGRRKR